MKIKRKRLWLGMVAFCLLTGCSKVEAEENKTACEYTVVKASDIPTQLAEEMETRKEEGFQITYKEGEYLYIARGYGQQESGGYSIEIESVERGTKTIDFKSHLYGPQKGEIVLDEVSYPYVVIKVENGDYTVNFL